MSEPRSGEERDLPLKALSPLKRVVTTRRAVMDRLDPAGKPAFAAVLAAGWRGQDQQ
jgi:hypothetical protein